MAENTGFSPTHAAQEFIKVFARHLEVSAAGAFSRGATPK